MRSLGTILRGSTKSREMLWENMLQSRSLPDRDHGEYLQFAIPWTEAVCTDDHVDQLIIRMSTSRCNIIYPQKLMAAHTHISLPQAVEDVNSMALTMRPLWQRPQYRTLGRNDVKSSTVVIFGRCQEQTGGIHHPNFRFMVPRQQEFHRGFGIP